MRKLARFEPQNFFKPMSRKWRPGGLSQAEHIVGASVGVGAFLGEGVVAFVGADVVARACGVGGGVGEGDGAFVGACVGGIVGTRVGISVCEGVGTFAGAAVAY